MDTGENGRRSDEERSGQNLRGRVVTPHGVIEDGVVSVVADRIAEVRPARRDDDGTPRSGVIVPGYVDIHCHGGGGASFTSGAADEIAAAADHHLRRGTTSVVAGLVTDTSDRMLAAVGAAADAADRDVIAGVFVEGPFLSTSRCGAQDPEHLRAPDTGFTRELIDAARGHLVAMTLAPELPGALDVIDLLHGSGVTASVGHTSCDATTADAALRRGRARGVTGLATHLFNGMPPLHHRAPGPVAAALTAAADLDARVELIVDGTHLDDATARLVTTLLPAGQTVLISDAMAAAGMPDGTYRLGPQDVQVADGVAKLVIDGEPISIAGSTIHLADAVRRLVSHAGADLTAAVTAATRTPAAVLHAAREAAAPIGCLVRGARADLLRLDDDLRVRQVMRRGGWVA
ncbi:N-acetylglucosamine-6-phosphate deacetylase [Streptomyces sp. AJS327]|uniref:N-acetylglucosamine-6-phosphate deacetylase n=1 Tax=Streptomyces sp. AJS327 TaxID=2545265 RepID=UPI0015DEB950|nr:amidohydrolase family protein [Streptomyces sp. AJS327]MBA0051284.1 N-acetylglucosamine-6-phosphate deacetylase [Streptomyces sp. AJS327]